MRPDTKAFENYSTDGIHLLARSSVSPLIGSLPRRSTAAHAKFMVWGFFKKWTPRSLNLFALIVFTSLPVSALPTNKSIWEFDRRVWYAQNGLPDEMILAITQTKNGYLWIGTRGGLARFDGFQFVLFDRSNTPAFHDDRVLSLYAARNGDLWVGTAGGGVVRYHDGVFKSFGEQQGLSNGFVRKIYQMRDGRLLVGTDHGLFLLKGKRFVRLDGRDGLPFISVHAITEDRRGRLWVGGSGLYVISHQKVKNIVLGRSMASDQIKSVFQSSDGTMWIGTYDGLYRLTPSGRILHGPFDNDVEANICQDRDGNVWVGWVGHGLSRYRKGSFRTYQAPAILPNNTVLSIYVDSEKDLWVGTEDGLLRISDTGVSVVENTDGISLGNTSTIYENVSTLYAAPDGSLWIADGHLYRIEGWRLLAYRLPTSVRNVAIRTVFEDSRGVLWIGTGGQGLVAIPKNGVAVHYTRKEGLVNDFIRAFCQDRKGNLWIGTDGGLSRWNGKEFRNYTTANGLVYPSIRTIVEDKAGYIWIGTDGGLCVIHDGKFMNDPALAALRNDKIWAIREDGSGTLWLGTRDEGLFRLKNGALSHYTTRCGLPDDDIYQILQDHAGNLWFSGRAGIFQISLANLNSSTGCQPGALAPTLYGSSQGSDVGEVNGGIQPAGSVTRSGVLWFPTSKGAIRIDPSEVNWSEKPRTLIESVEADGNDVSLKSHTRIPPGRGRLEINYTAPSLRAPEHIRFKYMLKGFDNQWTNASTRRVAYYTNLPPGNYEFKVVAYYNDAPNEMSEASFPFTWEARFYRTLWFDALVVLLIAGAVWVGLRVHLAQTKARYAAVLAERSRLAREMHDTVIQGCVGVSTLLEAVSSMPEPSSSTGQSLLTHAREEIRQTLNEARLAIWNMRYTSMEAEGLVSGLRHLARNFSAEKEVNVRTEVSGTPFYLEPQASSNLLLIAREAVRNALTHANAANVVIQVAFADHHVRIEVQDDGRGFDPQNGPPGKDEHYGIVGMRERAEELGGKFEIDAKPGKGTHVVVSIPAGGQKLHRQAD